MRVLGDSPRDWRVRRMLLLCRVPRFVRRGLAALLQALGQRRMARFLRAWGARPLMSTGSAPPSVPAYAEQFFAAWDHAQLDAAICPPHALPAVRHGSTADLTVVASYCFWANILGVPAGVVPATRVRADEETDRRVGRDTVDKVA